jgi:glycosyltransferase involved in cell wall biosynthesis
MPGPSIAPVKKFSHGVRWYDEPKISVIIPVGNGHLDLVTNALDSLDSQTYRHFETIVVFDVQPDTWEHAKLTSKLKYIADAWPDCIFTGVHAGGKHARELTSKLEADINNASILDDLPMGERAGPGVARNAGIELARAPLLFFLDADDWIVPETLEKMMRRFVNRREIVYTDHIGVATIPQDKLDQVDGKVVAYKEHTQEAYVQQGVSDYKCEIAQQQPRLDGTPPYVICNVSMLVPKSWVEHVGRFDTNVVSWEDVLLTWRLAWAGYCFTRIPEPLLVYRYGTGAMRQTGLENAQELLLYAKELSDKVKKVGCGCSQKKKLEEKNTMPAGTAVLRLSRGGQLQVNDNDLLLIEFRPKQAGHIQRYGQHNFGNGNRISYGVRKRVTDFLCIGMTTQPKSLLPLCRTADQKWSCSLILNPVLEKWSRNRNCPLSQNQ